MSSLCSGIRPIAVGFGLRFSVDVTWKFLDGAKSNFFPYTTKTVNLLRTIGLSFFVRRTRRTHFYFRFTFQSTLLFGNYHCNEKNFQCENFWTNFHVTQKLFFYILDAFRFLNIFSNGKLGIYDACTYRYHNGHRTYSNTSLCEWCFFEKSLKNFYIHTNEKSVWKL